MLGLSETIERIAHCRRAASYTAEMITRARELVVRSEDLLQQSAPTTFLGYSCQLKSMATHSDPRTTA